MQKAAADLHEKRSYADELNLRNNIVARTKKLYGEDSLEGALPVAWQEAEDARQVQI